MSHHFDTLAAREGPGINLSDFYFFRGTPGCFFVESDLR
jgi:hypothetical protein